MGAAPSLGLALSTVKYHYFDSFFTYSVRRRACAVVDSSRPRHGILDPRESRSRAPYGAWESRVGRPGRGFLFLGLAAPALVLPAPSSCLSLPIRFEDTARRGV